MSQIAREAVKQLYPYPAWSRRVDKMSDDQVTAIYLKAKAQGKL